MLNFLLSLPPLVNLSLDLSRTQKLNFHSLSSVVADWPSRVLPLFLLDGPNQGAGSNASTESVVDGAPKSPKPPHRETCLEEVFTTFFSQSR